MAFVSNSLKVLFDFVLRNRPSPRLRKKDVRAQGGAADGQMAGGDAQRWPRTLQKEKRPRRAGMAHGAPPAEEEDPRVRRGLALSGTQGRGWARGGRCFCEQDGGDAFGEGKFCGPDSLVPPHPRLVCLGTPSPGLGLGMPLKIFNILAPRTPRVSFPSPQLVYDIHASVLLSPPSLVAL